MLSVQPISPAPAISSSSSGRGAVPGEAKIEAGSFPLYADAEADYEECSRLCLTL